MSRFPKRVVITGIGAVAPNGLGIVDYRAALMAGNIPANTPVSAENPADR